MSTSKLVEGGAGPETTQTLKVPIPLFALRICGLGLSSGFRAGGLGQSRSCWVQSAPGRALASPCRPPTLHSSRAYRFLYTRAMHDAPDDAALSVSLEFRGSGKGFI